mmetsp:Transcript_39525/g.88452  ORF Transcript_39525/g.88452 Transcript_39525/m.88452 type:complete len:253 (+) Transcript_39525:71-829(+)
MGCVQANQAQVQKELEFVRAENDALRAENQKLRGQLQRGGGAASPSGVHVEAPSAAAAEVVRPDPPAALAAGSPTLPGLTGDREASPSTRPAVAEAAESQPRHSGPEQAAAPAEEPHVAEAPPAFAGLKRGFLTAPHEADAQAIDEMIQAVKTSPANKSAAYSYSVAGREHAKEELGGCMLCLEPLPNDPREVINLCASEPRCLCLLHRSCFLNPQYEMSDNFRRCMICKKPADPAMVRMAVQARKKPLGSR